MNLKTKEFPRQTVPRSLSPSPEVIRVVRQSPCLLTNMKSTEMESDRGSVNEKAMNFPSKPGEPRAQKCRMSVSRYYGVRFRPDLQRWVAEIRVTEWKSVDKKVWLGTFDTEEGAARGIDLARKLLKCAKKRPLNFPCEALRSYSKTLPSHLDLGNIDDDHMFKEVIAFVKREAQEYVANFSANSNPVPDDTKTASFSPMQTVARDEAKARLCPQVAMDVSLAEITAESSPCPETNSLRKRKFAAGTNADAEDLVTQLAPILKQEIKDVLSSALLPLVSVLRSREEDEQKHRERMLALEEQKLALKREKLLFERRRGSHHRTSSPSPSPARCPDPSSPETEPCARNLGTFWH